MLVLLVVAFMGPWFYTLDGVPPPEWCHEPQFLLENGRCAGLVTGAFIIAFMSGAFYNVNVGLVTGLTDFPERARELLGINVGMLFTLLLLLPLITTMLMIWRKDSGRLRVFHVMVLGLAAVLSWLPVVFEPVLRSGRFWGMWLYIVVAFSALTLEVLGLISERKH